MAQASPDGATLTPRIGVDAQPASRTWRGHLWRTARNVLLIYLGLCVAMWFFQDKLIFPGAASQGQPWAVVHASAAYELVELCTGEGVRTFAAFVTATDAERRPRADAARRPTLIYFYGNGEHLAHALGAARYFASMGVNVLAVEYPGYGMADGRPGEKSFYAAADAAYDHLLTRSDVDPRRIVPTGLSIGGGPAIDLASRRPSAGLVCFSPFTSMTAMARRVAPWLPTSLLLAHRFDNQTKLRSFTGPVFIAHGRDDEIVPFAMGEALARSAGGSVTFVALEGAGHNNVFEADSERLVAALRAFFDQITGDTGAPPTEGRDRP